MICFNQSPLVIDIDINKTVLYNYETTPQSQQYIFATKWDNHLILLKQSH